MSTKIRFFIWGIVGCLICLLIFYNKAFSSRYALWSGNDMSDLHYISRVFLKQSLAQGVFPFFTERVFGGYEIFLDLEKAYLNPINILTVYYFSPATAIKILFFGSYIFGFLSLFYLLKQKFNNIIGALLGTFMFFNNHFVFYHTQHLNMIVTFFSIPLGMVLLYKLFTKNNQIFSILLGLLFIHLFSLGSQQALFINILVWFLYSLTFPKYVKNYIKLTLPGAIFAFIIIAPIISDLARFYKESERNLSANLHDQGVYSSTFLEGLIIPNHLGTKDTYIGGDINIYYYEEETYAYSGLLFVIIGIMGIFFIKEKKTKVFLLTSLSIGFLISLGFLAKSPLFDLFRFWNRAIVMVILTLSFGVANIITLAKSRLSKIIIFSIVAVAVIELAYFNIKKVDQIMFIPAEIFENFCPNNSITNFTLARKIDNINRFNSLCFNTYTFEGYSVFAPKNIDKNRIDLFTNNEDFIIRKEKENWYKVSTSNSKSTRFFTNIRYTPHWHAVTMEGKKLEVTDNESFIGINLNESISEFTLKYIPYRLFVYLGLSIFTDLILVYGLCIKKQFK